MTHKKIPNEWSIAKFGDLLDVKSGFGFKYAEYSPEGIPLVKIDNVSHGKITWDNISYLPQSYVEDYQDILLNEGDILVALNRPITQNKLKIARLTRSDVPSILYQRVGKIVHKDARLDRSFTFYLLQRDIFYFVRKNAVGSDQPFISITELRKYPLVFPSLPEQRQIADILSIWDKAITLTDRLIVAKQRRKKALMQQLLTGRWRFQEFTQFREEQSSPIYDLPNGWEYKTILQLGDNNSGIVQTGPFGAQLHASDYVDDGVPLILIRNIDGNRLNLTNIPKITPEDAYRLRRYALKENDIVFSRVGRVGSCFLAGKEHQGWIISGQTLRIRLPQNVVDHKYLLYALHSSEAQSFITGTSVGSTRKSTSTKVLESLPVLLPPLPEQRKIAAVLQACDAEIELLGQKLAALKRQKKGLMQQLLTGRVRVVA